MGEGGGAEELEFFEGKYEIAKVQFPVGAGIKLQKTFYWRSMDIFRLNTRSGEIGVKSF